MHTQCSFFLQPKRRCEDSKRFCLSVCRMMTDSNRRINFSSPQIQRKDMRTLGFEDSDAKSLFVVEPCVSSLGQITEDNTWTLNLT